jgi:hypothetical protein
MKEELHRQLDGEERANQLGEGPKTFSETDLPEELDAWGRLLGAFQVELAQSAPPPWLESRVMAEIEALPEPGRLKRLGNWLLAPRPLRVSPLLAGAAATAVLALLLFGRLSFPGVVQGPGEATVVYVQFAFEAPGAQSVAVAGDFDGWAGSHSLEDGNGDGVWTGRIPLEPGVHTYMFLIDGATWQTDPRAERYADDGFGNRNAVLAVAAPSA